MLFERVMKTLIAMLALVGAVGCGRATESSRSGLSTGSCETITTACDCYARQDCVIKTEDCWCPSECVADLVCVCGGGRFLSCASKP
jgi:hypothetical protein